MSLTTQTAPTTNSLIAKSNLEAVGYDNLVKQGAGLSGSPDALTETLQTILKEKGFYKGSVDGKFGNQTLNALAAFQKKFNQNNPQLGADKNLKVDGIFGPRSAAALFGKPLPNRPNSRNSINLAKLPKRPTTSSDQLARVSSRAGNQTARAEKVSLPRRPQQSISGIISEEAGLAVFGGVNSSDIQKDQHGNIQMNTNSNMLWTNSGIGIFASSGKLGKGAGQTGLTGMSNTLVNCLKEFHKESNLPLLITGGTEVGGFNREHAKGIHSHGSGDKADIHAYPETTAWIRENMRQIQPKFGNEAFVYERNGFRAVFEREGNHWDIKALPSNTKVV